MLQDMLYDWSLLHIYLKQHHLSVVSVSIGYFHCPIYVTEMRKKNLILQKKIFPIFISIKYLWKICYTRQIAKKICILYYLVFCMLTSAKIRYELKYEALLSKWACERARNLHIKRVADILEINHGSQNVFWVLTWVGEC